MNTEEDLVRDMPEVFQKELIAEAKRYKIKGDILTLKVTSLKKLIVTAKEKKKDGPEPITGVMENLIQ